MTQGKLPLTPWKAYNIVENPAAAEDDVFEDVELKDARHDKLTQHHPSHQPSLSDCETDLALSTQVGAENVENSSTTATKGLSSCFRTSRQSSGTKVGLSSSHPARKIQFNEMAMVIWIESIDDMSDEELDSCFMAPQDYLDIREREKNLFRQLSTMGIIRSAGDDCLGLETRVQRYQRKARSRESIYAVIFEQEMNRDSKTGVCNGFFLAQVYQPYTEVAARIALDRATRNAMQASLCDSSRYLDIANDMAQACSPLKLQSDEPMEEVYHELKEAVETVQENVYKGVMKYAVACIPPSPATLRLGHGNFLEMSQKEDEQPWPEQQNPGKDENPAEFYDDGYEQDGEEKKSEAPSRQEIIRNSFEPPRFTQCGQDYYQTQVNVQHHQHHQMVMKLQTQSRWMADQHNRGAFQASQQHLQAQYSGPPNAGWVWNPALCDFVPVPTTRTVRWNV